MCTPNTGTFFGPSAFSIVSNLKDSHCDPTAPAGFSLLNYYLVNCYQILTVPE